MTAPIFNPDADTALDNASEQMLNQLEALTAEDRFESPVWITNRAAIDILADALAAERFDPEIHDDILAKIGICPCGGCKTAKDNYKGLI